MKPKILLAVVLALACASVQAQVNSGSNGSDGAFNPATNTVINMADHPDGIYQYTSVNISNGVTVTFIPNGANTPVVWLVQGSCIINGSIKLNGQYGPDGGVGGPGGFRGGNMGGGGSTPGNGQGPGGGKPSSIQMAGNASFADSGAVAPIIIGSYYGRTNFNGQAQAGENYGNEFCLPFIGGSGGGGIGGIAYTPGSGGGGGGAIIIAASDTIQLNGSISASGGGGGGASPYPGGQPWAGSGSGGAVRLIATHLLGTGNIDVSGGTTQYSWSNDYYGYTSGTTAGSGRVRQDSLDNLFAGTVSGRVTRGYQPIIIPPASQAVILAIQSVAGVAVASSPTASLTTPDIVVPSAQQNPVAIVVRCVNIPLNTDIIVDVKPANGPTIRAVGANNTGTQASSTATVSVTMPRGAGTIQAKAISGIAGSLGASLNNGEKFRHYAQTGLTADGELFSKMEITATLGGGQEIAYITESGKRFVLPCN